MSLTDDAKAFLQGEVGKFLAIPSRLATMQQQVAAVVATGNPAKQADAATLGPQVTALQQRTATVNAAVQALIPRLQGGAIQNLDFGGLTDLASSLVETSGQVVGLLGDVDQAEQQVQALYYGTPGAKVAGTVPGWVWWAGGAAAVWWVFLRRRR